MQQSARLQIFFSQSYYMSASSTLVEDLFPSDCDGRERHEAELQLQGRLCNPIALYAEMMGDIIYFHQALKQPDARNIVQAVVKKVNGYVENKH